MVCMPWQLRVLEKAPPEAHNPEVVGGYSLRPGVFTALIAAYAGRNDLAGARSVLADILAAGLRPYPPDFLPLLYKCVAGLCPLRLPKASRPCQSCAHMVKI